MYKLVGTWNIDINYGHGVAESGEITLVMHTLYQDEDPENAIKVREGIRDAVISQDAFFSVRDYCDTEGIPLKYTGEFVKRVVE